MVGGRVNSLRYIQMKISTDGRRAKAKEEEEGSAVIRRRRNPISTQHGNGGSQ